MGSQHLRPHTLCPLRPRTVLPSGLIRCREPSMRTERARYPSASVLRRMRIGRMEVFVAHSYLLLRIWRRVDRSGVTRAGCVYLRAVYITAVSTRTIKTPRVYCAQYTTIVGSVSLVCRRYAGGTSVIRPCCNHHLNARACSSKKTTVLAGRLCHFAFLAHVTAA